MAETTLDSDVSKPSRTAAGDGPADTTNPLERASTVVPRPGADALRAGTVNSQLPLEPIPAPASGKRSKEDRVEEYDATDAFGRTVRVQHNLETGESRVAAATDTGAQPVQSGSNR